MHGPGALLLLLLGGTIVVLLVQSLRLGRQRAIAARYEAAAMREHERQAAVHERSARAIAGESSAHTLLLDAGFDVLDRQVAGSWTLHADGQPQTFDLRADYLVTDGRRRYIAEVKTGQRATRLSHGATRRQLLEYWAALDVEGVLLVDADLGSVTHVDIDPMARLAAKRETTPSAPSGRANLWLLGAVALAAFIAGLLMGTRMSG
jgi:hypothetical protein